jgi:hypothetical protein
MLSLPVHRDPARRNFDRRVTSSRSSWFSSVVNGDNLEQLDVVRVGR